LLLFTPYFSKLIARVKEIHGPEVVFVTASTGISHVHSIFCAETAYTCRHKRASPPSPPPLKH